MLSILVHTQSLRFALPTCVLVGVSPHFFFGWLSLRLATVILPRRIYERLDELAYDSYQSLVAYFFETYAGTKVLCCLVKLSVCGSFVFTHFFYIVGYIVYRFFHFRFKSVFCFKVVFYGDDLPIENKENVVYICNHQSSGKHIMVSSNWCLMHL